MQESAMLLVTIFVVITLGVSECTFITTMEPARAMSTSICLLENLDPVFYGKLFPFPAV